MRDALPRRPKKHESVIVNLDISRGAGTHWVCYRKRDRIVHYFDSFGNLRPPSELTDYFGRSVDIRYNTVRKQSFNSVLCGHLCLKFLQDVLS